MATPSVDLLPAELHGQVVGSIYNFDQLYKFAQVAQASGLFTDIADAAQAFMKVCKGAELGLPPTTSMTAFDIIAKRLFIKPWAIAAKINSCGYGSYHIETQTPEECVILFRRKYAGRGWVTLEPVRYTITEAREHGLVQRSPHWKASPAHMLYQRCMGRGGAMYFPELLAGLTPPPDDAPIAPDDHEANVTALFGEPVNPTAPEALHRDTGAFQPAGEAGLPYIAQIEAAILAQHGVVEDWFVWAERTRFKKPRVQFTEADYQSFLQVVRDQAAKNAPQTHDVAPGQAIPPAHVDADAPSPEALVGHPGAPHGPTAGQATLWEEEEARERQQSPPPDVVG